MTIADRLNGKKILIWGYGREGRSTEAFLLSHCPDAQLQVFEGGRDEIDEDAYDLIIKSPGIKMAEDDPRYTSQTELFLESFRDQVVGITGTKGKSTTATLLYEAIRACDRDALFVGNIGRPCFDDVDRLRPDTVIIYEMSCHQLAHAHVSPHIAVFLNLFEEHLDYYGTLQNYFEAKSNIARHQKEGDVFLRGWNVPEIETRARVVALAEHPERDWHLKISGEQNRYNAETAYYIATELLGLDHVRVREAIERYAGLPHRLQLLGMRSGVFYYDDSISTIPEATVAAVHGIDNVRTVLIGGMDRGIDYHKLVELILDSPAVQFICAYDSGKRVFQETLERCRKEGRELPGNLHSAADLREQVEMAARMTPEGEACILSPAAASYGYFKNFEERGDVFRELVFGHDR